MLPKASLAPADLSFSDKEGAPSMQLGWTTKSTAGLYILDASDKKIAGVNIGADGETSLVSRAKK